MTTRGGGPLMVMPSQSAIGRSACQFSVALPASVSLTCRSTVQSATKTGLSCGLGTATPLAHGDALAVGAVDVGTLVGAKAEVGTVVGVAGGMMAIAVAVDALVGVKVGVGTVVGVAGGAVAAAVAVGALVGVTGGVVAVAVRSVAPSPVSPSNRITTALTLGMGIISQSKQTAELPLTRPPMFTILPL